MKLNRLYFAKSSLAQLNFSKSIARHVTETTLQYSPDCAVLAHSQMTDGEIMTSVIDDGVVTNQLLILPFQDQVT